VEVATLAARRTWARDLVSKARSRFVSTKPLRKRPLSVPDILRWASAHREATGKWPGKSSGAIAGTRFETWLGVDQALQGGFRDLPGGSSLAQLLNERCGVRNRRNLAALTPVQILRWADEHHARTGSWPTVRSAIPAAPGETWKAIDSALRWGGRGLAGGCSLARLLAEHREVRNPQALPPYTEEQILKWADALHERTGVWPTAKSGPITGAPGETWMAVQMALHNGIRGLPGGSSLSLLLAQKRGVRNVWSCPNLSIGQVLAWADAFHERTGNWPNSLSGRVSEAPAETWTGVDLALKRGHRGLPGGYSLAELLALERGARNLTNVPKLSRRQILAWMDAWHRRSGEWPTHKSGPIPESPGDTWWAVDAALRTGNRGLRPGSSLARLLAQCRGRRHRLEQPALTKKQILAWADKHQERTGKWPNAKSGAVADAPDERWESIDHALRKGRRGQPGGSSLLRLLMKKRGARNKHNPPPLTEERILRWAEHHLEQTGSWPTSKFGPIVAAPGETWLAVNSALRYGKRGLAPGSSLAKLLRRNRESATSALGH
jgi:hypothetical protein